MKTLKLNHNLAQKIINGELRSTWRLFDDKNLRVNDVVVAIDKVIPSDESSWKPIGEMYLTEVREKRLGDIGPEDYASNKERESLKKLLKRLSGYYKGQKITEDLPIKLIRFDFKQYDDNYVFNRDRGLVNNNDVFKTTNKAILYTDGGSRGNPGPSATGFAIYDDNNLIEKGGVYLGVTTNNQAEYQALKNGLERVQKLGFRQVSVRMDSMLVVNQMKGIFKIKNRDLWPIHEDIKALTKLFESISFSHVPRELNKIADGEVNRVLDKHLADTKIQNAIM